jgi:hypothetical protein
MLCALHHGFRTTASQLMPRRGRGPLYLFALVTIGALLSTGVIETLYPSGGFELAPDTGWLQQPATSEQGAVWMMLVGGLLIAAAAIARVVAALPGSCWRAGHARRSDRLNWRAGLCLGLLIGAVVFTSAAGVVFPTQSFDPHPTRWSDWEPDFSSPSAFVWLAILPPAVLILRLGVSWTARGAAGLLGRRPRLHRGTAGKASVEEPEADQSLVIGALTVLLGAAFIGLGLESFLRLWTP